VTQTIATWTRTSAGPFSWNVAANWSGDVVPNGGNFNAFLTRSGAAYTVVATGALELGFLETGANATLKINVGELAIDNALANTGALNLNSSAAGDAVVFLGNGSASFSFGNSGAIDLDGVTDSASLVFEDVVTELVGGGTINLAGFATVSGTVAGRTVLNYDNTIQGSGSIGGGLIVANESLGTINANASGALTIDAELLSNDGVIETTGAGGLTIDGAGDDSADSNFTNDGDLIAGGSGALTLNDIYVTGGGVAETTVKGAAIVLDNATLDVANISIAAQSFLRTETGTTNEIDGFVDNAGTITVANGSTLIADIDLSGNGVLRISSSTGVDALQTALALDHDSEIQAGASVILSAGGDNLLGSSGPAVNLFNAGSITGAGTIGDDALRIVNRQSGVVDANVKAGLDLVVNESASPDTAAFNGGLIEATGAGVLTISSSTPGTEQGFTNSGTIDDAAPTPMTLSDLVITGAGTIETSASGAVISLNDTAIESGIVSLVAGSTLQMANSNTDWIETDVDNAGTISIGGDDTFDVEGNWVNSGALDVDGLLDIVGGSRLALQGGGTVNLSFDGLIQSDDGIGGSGTASLLNLSDTIVGDGEIIDSSLSLDNSKFGTIDATGSGPMIIDTGSNDVVNQGTIEASNSGPAATSATLMVDSELDNSGQVIAGRGSWIDLSNNAIGGGIARINSTGELEMDGTDSLDVVFSASAHGTLALDDSASTPYGGIISGFTANDKIDLADIGFIQGTTNAAFFGNAVQGQLTVTDGTNTTTLHMLGNYTQTAFQTASDGHGGTIVTI
jgi:hypothetical protein